MDSTSGLSVSLSLVQSDNLQLIKLRPVLSEAFPLLPSFNMNEEVNQALQMLVGGSTRGMVIAHFRREGLSKHQSNELVSAAVRIVNRRILVRSIGILFAGILAIVIGVLLFLDGANQKMFDAQTAGIVTMTGLISTIFGLLEMCRSRI